MIKLSVGDVVEIENGNRYLVTCCNSEKGNSDKAMPCIIGLNSYGIPRAIPECQITEIIFHDKMFVETLSHLEQL